MKHQTEQFNECGSNQEAYNNSSEEEHATKKSRNEPPSSPALQPRALTPPTCQNVFTDKCTYFKIPPEIRRDILIIAFGDRRIHLDVDCDRPDAGFSLSDPIFNEHHEVDNVMSERAAHDSKCVIEAQTKPWQWRSSVCHRSPSVSKVLASSGPLKKGVSCCHSSSGNVPDQCQIGIMGWLLSCRQNYQEAINVLYSTNTIVMASELMITHLPNLLLPQRLATMMSLEICWPLKTRAVEDDPDDVTEFIDIFYDYPEVFDQDYLELVLQSLSSSFSALRHLDLFLEETYEFCFCDGSNYLPIVKNHLDPFARRMVTHDRFAVWLPEIMYQSVLKDAKRMPLNASSETSANLFERIWRSYNGEMTTMQFSDAKSYSGPASHVAGSRIGGSRSGYWIVNRSAQK